MSAALEIAGLSVSYGTNPVLDALDLSVAAGETMALLGPSGSGKTTLLGAVAGFVPISDGTLEIDGFVVARGTPPEERAVSMVFQNYALWPHMTALQIVAYPLERTGIDRAEALPAAAELLERVGIGDLGDRYPSELSGGQQQRVGLARALARQPALYLFDEPTAHLDAALRTLLQEELVERQHDSGAAALYATHDPQEALAVADRVALLRNGRIVQVGTPREVYETPADEWAARLTGPAESLPVELIEYRDDVVTLRLGDLDVAVAGGGAHSGDLTAIVRPEWASLGGRLPGVVHRVRFTGARCAVLVDSPFGSVWIDAPSPARVTEGESVGWSLQRVWLAAR